MASNEQISILLKFNSDLAGITGAQQEISNLSRTLTSFASGFGVALSAGGLLSGIRAIENFASNIVNLAGRLEISTDAFQHLSNIARQNGVDMNQLTVGLSKLRASMDSAAEGSPKLVQAFHDLGLDAKTLADAPLDEALRAIAIQIVNATDKTVALNAANEILGTRSMPRLLEIVQQLGAGYQDTGQIIDKDYLERVRQAQIATENFIVKVKDMLVLTFGDALTIPRQLRGGDMATALDARIKETEKSIADYKQILAQLRQGYDERNPFQSLFTRGPTIRNFENGLVTATKHLAELRAEKEKLDKAPPPTPVTTPLLEAAKAEAVRQEAIAKAQQQTKEQTADQLRSLELQRAQTQDHTQQVAILGKEIGLEQGLLATLKQKRDALELGSVERKKADTEYEAQANKVLSLEKERERIANEGARSAKQQADQQAHSAALAAEVPLQEKLRDVEKERSLIIGNHLLDSITKQQRLNDNAEEYRKIVAKIVALEKQRLAAAKDPLETARINAEIGRLNSSSAEYGKRDTQPTRQQSAAAEYHSLQISDPTQHFTSAGGGLLAGMQQYAARIGTLGDQVNAKFQTVAQTITGSVSSGIEGLINHTESWRQALGNVASAIEGAIINAIVEMGVQWVTQQIMMAVVGKTIAASSLAANEGIALAQSAIWAAPATLATIASFGGAALAAPLEIGGAMLATQGLALASDGGVFDGDPSKPRGIFHGGEGVLTARAMRSPGMAAFVDAMNAGNHVAALTSLSASAQARLSGAGTRASTAMNRRETVRKASIALVDDRSAVRTELRRTGGQQAVIDVIRNNRGSFFI